MKITPQQDALIDVVSRFKAEATVIETKARARLEQEVRQTTATAWQKVDDALADAHDAGVPVRRLLVAYGTKDFNTVKSRIDAGKARRSDRPTEEQTHVLADFLNIGQSPQTDTAWRVFANYVPRDLWTYTPQGGDAYDVIPALYNAHIDVDKVSGNVSTRGENSDPKGPLHLEWARGKGNIRDILKTMEA